MPFSRKFVGINLAPFYTLATFYNECENFRGGKLATLLWINPNSRSGDQGHESFAAELEALGEVHTFFAGKDADLGAAINELRGRIERIVVGGGDGTIHFAIPHVVESGLPLGIIPLGTGNDFARSLEIPLDPSEAIRVIKEDRQAGVDIGKVNDQWFLNAVGIGLGPELTKALDKETKRTLGVLAYLKGFLHVFNRLKSRRLKLIIDGNKVTTRFVQLTIANGIHYGGGMTISQEATLFDGNLRILVLKPQSKLALLRKAITLRWGAKGNEREPDLLTFEGKRVEVRTSNRYDASVDGELVTTTPLVCECVHLKGQVYIPKTTNSSIEDITPGQKSSLPD